MLDQFTDSITDPEHFDRAHFVDILRRICELFHISKGVTEFFASERNEKEGRGETLIDYDNGRGEAELMKRRYVTKTGSVIRSTLYRANEDDPLEPEKYEKVDIILRSVLFFISRNRMVDAIERFTFTDEEGYPNIRSFLRHIDRAYEKGELEMHTAICFNLRHFSVVNQQIGRENGTNVMKAYTAALKEAAGEKEILCRLGGDNFLMTTETGNLGEVMSILSGFLVPYGPEANEKVMVSASAGVFVISQEYKMSHPGEVLERTYSTMQIARTMGDDPIVFYDEDFVKRKAKAIQVQQDFPEAIKNGEFHVYYQPKVNVHTGMVSGAEALCRWIKDGHPVPPVDFIPILEQGLEICRLDFHMLDMVCADIRRWLDEGRKVPRISVNLSRKHMTDMNLLTHIMEIVERHQVPHDRIEIELTETTTDVGFRDLTRVVNGLRDEQIYTSVDDFGIGYSSLNLIRELPWNVLKVDRSFLPMDDENENSVTNIMYKHVISMARDLGLECITEGVETEHQVEILKKNHCDVAQGYYFDKPLPVEEFENKMEHCYYKK